MTNAKYNFEDVKHFLKEQYNLDWNGIIYDTNNHITRAVNEKDIKGDYNLFSEFVSVIKNNKEIKVVIQAADIYFNVISEENSHNPKTELWLEYLSKKENTQLI